MKCGTILNFFKLFPAQICRVSPYIYPENRIDISNSYYIYQQIYPSRRRMGPRGIILWHQLGQNSDRHVNTETWRYGHEIQYQVTCSGGANGWQGRRAWVPIHLETYKQKRSTEGCSKFKSLETIQVQERLVSTFEHMQVPKWDRTRCPEEWASPVGMPHPLQMLYGNQYLVKCQVL